MRGALENFVCESDFHQLTAAENLFYQLFPRGVRKHTFIMVHAGSEAEESAAAVTYLEGRESWKLLQRLMR